jgi:hypothetical protein
MAKRREYLKATSPDVVIGCPLCNVPGPAAAPRTQQQNQQQ